VISGGALAPLRDVGFVVGAGGAGDVWLRPSVFGHDAIVDPQAESAKVALPRPLGKPAFSRALANL
jgi:hypothetical protein